MAWKVISRPEGSTFTGSSSEDYEAQKQALKIVPGSSISPEIFAGLSRAERAKLAKQLLGEPPEASISQQALKGYLAGASGIARNIGIPGTDIDLGRGLEAMGAIPHEQLAREAEAAGGIAPAARFATEVAATMVPGVRAGKLAGQLLGKAPGIIKGLAPLAAEGAVTAGLTGEDVVQDVAGGAIGGVVGGKLISGVGKLATGIKGVSEQARRLIGEGIPMTPGQAMANTTLGRIYRNIEDASTSLPFGLGSIVSQKKQLAYEGLRGRALKDALPPGMPLPKSAGAEPLTAIDEIGEEFHKRYDDILGQLDNEAFELPADFSDNLLKDAFSKKRFITPDRRAHTEAMIRDAVEGQNTAGLLFQAQSDLRKEARSLMQSAGASNEDRSAADALYRASNKILNSLGEATPQLKELAKPYSNFAVMSHEMSKVAGFGEKITPTQIRKMAQRSGNVELEAIARAGESILPSRLPESGTAPRLAMMLGGGALGAAGGSGDPMSDFLKYGAAAAMLPVAGAALGTGSRYAFGQIPYQQKLARILSMLGPTAGGVYSTRDQ